MTGARHPVRLAAALLTLLLAAPRIGLADAETEPTPYQRMLDAPLSYGGPEGPWGDVATLEEVRIGLFAPTTTGDPEGRALWEGATLAVEEANGQGGLTGLPFRLVSRWASDPWGAGSKEMIRLVYGDRVWAVVGSVSGEATHVAEQVALKSRVPLLCPISADSTLTYVPFQWIFRLPPDDRRQADLLVREGIVRRRHARVALLSSTDHDGRVGGSELLDALRRQGLSPVCHLHVPSAETLPEIASRVRGFAPDGILLRLPRGQVPRALAALHAAGLDCPVLQPWIPGLDLDSLRPMYRGEAIGLLPFAQDPGREAWRRFEAAFVQRFAARPDPCAAYAYDATRLIVEALRRCGLNRVRLREALAASSGFDGASGRIAWDNVGGNLASPVLPEGIPDTGAQAGPDARAQ